MEKHFYNCFSSHELLFIFLYFSLVKVKTQEAFVSHYQVCFLIRYALLCTSVYFLFIRIKVGLNYFSCVISDCIHYVKVHAILIMKNVQILSSQDFCLKLLCESWCDNICTVVMVEMSIQLLKQTSGFTYQNEVTMGTSEKSFLLLSGGRRSLFVLH